MKNNTEITKKYFRSLLLIAVAMSASSGALAVDGGNTLTLEEIIVTATKRAQSLEEVPVSAVVKSGEWVEIGGFKRVSDIQYSIPGFVMTGQENSGWIQMTMRGISTPAVSSGFSLGTGMYIDGVEQGPPIAFKQELVDVAQIEVLRGPQGTLFGKNTIAGTFNITTRKPSQEFEAYASADVGNYDQRDLDVSISGGITDTMSARVSIFTRKHDGYVENKFTGGSVNDQDQIGGRIQLRFEPSTDLTVDLSVDYMEEDRHFAYHEVSAPINGTPSDGMGGWDWAGTDPASANTINQIPAGQNTISHTFDDTEERELYGVQALIEYDISDELIFTSVSGFRHGMNDILEDTDHTSWNETNYTSYKSFDQLTQEFRIASQAASGKGDWDYLAGLYLSSLEQDEVLSYGFYEDNGVMSGALEVPGTNPVAILRSTADISTKTVALFGNANYMVTDDLLLNLGARVGQEDKDIGIAEDADGIIPDTPYFTESFGDTNVSPTLGFTYFLTENANVYGKVTSGFKSGGFNTGIFKSGNTDIVFESENVISYEMGVKGSAFDRRVVYSLAAYTMDYEDLQVEIYVPLGDGLAGTREIRNAADAEIKGVELEMSMLLLEGLTTNLGVAYSDATYENFIDDNAGNPIDYSGNQLPNAPEWTGNVDLTYTFPIGGMGDLVTWVQYTYRDEWYSFQSNSDLELNDSYGLVNARIAFESESGWTVAAWGKNLADEEYTTETWQLGGLNQERKGFYRPRTYGVNLTYRY